MRKGAVLILLLGLPQFLSGQCFTSAGNPVGGSGNIGTLDTKTISIVTFYQHSLSDRYFEGHQILDQGIISSADFNLAGMLLAYGITNKLTLEGEVGFFINKTKHYSIPEGFSLKGSGLTNGVISAKYQVYYNPDSKVEFSAAGGLKFPFTPNTQKIEHVRLPFDLQPSTNALGAVIQAFLIKQHSLTGMRYFLYNRLEINGVNRDGYRSGNSLSTSLFLSRHLIRTSNWPVSGTVILQLRNELRGVSYIYEETEPSSGSVKFFLSPQLNLAFHEKWNLSVLVDIPLYQYYKNIQLANRVGFSVILVKPVEL